MLYNFVFRKLSCYFRQNKPRIRQLEISSQTLNSKQLSDNILGPN